MKINLRQAHALQAEINNFINCEIPKVKVNMIQLDEFSDVRSTMKSMEEEANKRIKNIDTLINIVYQIRLKIKRSNVQNGIEDLLAELEAINAMIRYYSDLVNLKPRSDLNALSNRASKMKEADDKFGMLTSGLYTQEQLDQFEDRIKKMKKDKRKLNDLLIEENVKNFISLSNDEIETLTMLGFI